MEGLLTKPTKYNIEDSNIALLGSDVRTNLAFADQFTSYLEVASATSILHFKLSGLHRADPKLLSFFIS